MKCPNCDFIERDEAFGDPATCPKCGAIYEKALRVKALRDQQEEARRKKAEAEQAKAAAAAAKARAKKEAEAKAEEAMLKATAERAAAELEAKERQSQQAATQERPETQKVVITNINIPFWSLVRLLVELAVAAIPAAFIVMILFAGFAAIFRIIF